MIGTATGFKVKPTSSPTLLLTFSSIIFRIGVKIVWTLVWDFGCNNWRLCVVFLDGTSLKVGDGRKEGQGGQVGGRGVQVGGQGSEVNDAQVGDQGRGQGNGRNQNSNAANDNIQGDVSRGCTYKEFLACNPKEYDGKGGMSWEDFKTLTKEEFCSSNEMQKLETELWNHAMVGAGYAAYTDRFHELARLVPHLVTSEATEPKTIQKAVQIAGILTNEALRNGSIKKNPEKRGNWGEPSRDKNVRDDNKRTRTRNAFATTANPVRREYTGTAPKKPRPARDVTSVVVPTMLGSWELREPGKRKGIHVGSRGGSLGPEHRNGFISTTFIPLLDVESIDLEFSYEIEIASEQLVEIDKVIRGCKLEIEGYVFDINLIPFGSGSFDVIIGMDW
ncbi:reverse transcriptase domain-containing protein [Tanacetum coccineum]